MAICPYLTQITSTTVDTPSQSISFTSTCEACGSGSGWKLNSGSIDSYTSTINNDTKWAVCNGDGTVTLNSETKTCQLWDSVNSRCSTQVSDTIRNTSVNENDVLITLLEKVLGKETERDESNSLINYLQDILGTHSEKDTISTLNDASLVKYTKDILGTHSEKDTISTSNDASLVKYTKDILGTHSEKDEDNSLTIYLQDIIGAHSEKDTIDTANDASILKYNKDIIGAHSEKTSELDTLFKRLSQPAAAATLLSEFFNNQDLDNNGKIYGKDFKITDNSEKPQLTYTAEYTGQWIDPGIEIIWNDYLTWFLDPESVLDPLA